MMIQILGTAQDGGVPQVACQCPTCTDARRHPERMRKGPSIGIYDEVNGHAYIVDASPHFDIQLEMLWQAVRQVRIPGPFPLDALFLTHGHFGHYWGLGYLGKEACSSRELPVYCTRDMLDFLSANRPFADLIQRKNIVFHPIEDGLEIPVHPDLTVIPYAVEHRRDVTDTVGYILKGKMKTALYIPDMDDVTEGIVGKIAQADIALIDGCFYSGAELPGRDMREVPHPLIPDAMDRLQELAASTDIVFTHFNHTNLAIRPDSEESRRVIDRGFSLARDGDEWAI